MCALWKSVLKGKLNPLGPSVYNPVVCLSFRNTATTEDILKVVKQDVKIIGPYNFSQSTTCQLMIPTSTPPTIRFKDKTLHIHYKVRVRVRLGKAENTTSSTLEMPFVVGTWPRADIPIDDDDDDELIQLLGETMLSEDDDDDDNGYHDGDVGNGNGPYESDRRETNLSLSSHQKRYSVLSSSSATTLTMQKNNALVGRSDSTQSRVSHKSIGSVSSWRSSQSLENNNLSRTTSASLAPGDPQQYQQQMYQGYGRNSTSSDMIYPSSNHLNRSSSTPDLLANPTSFPYQGHYAGGPYLQHQNTYPLHENRQSLYEDGMYRGSAPYYQQGPSSYSAPPTQQQQQQQPQQQYIPYSNNLDRGSTSPSSSLSSYSPYQHHRMGSEEYRPMGIPSPQQQQGLPPPLIDDVPTKVLQPMPTTSTPTNPTINRFRPQTATSDSTNSSAVHKNGDYPLSNGGFHDNGNGTQNMATISDDDDDDDSDDGDLFVIIERKKKQAEREMRQKQRTMYTVTE